MTDTDLGLGVIATLAFAGVGLAVLTLGYVMLDLITPGKLRELVFVERNVNASVVVCGNVLALAAIVTTTILESDDNLTTGLVQAGRQQLPTVDVVGAGQAPELDGRVLLRRRTTAQTIIHPLRAPGRGSFADLLERFL